jgi:hypothetical protein
MFIPMVFSTFLIYFIFSTGHHLTEEEVGADGGFVYEKKGQNRKVEKIGAKSPLDCIVGARSPISLIYNIYLITYGYLFKF